MSKMMMRLFGMAFVISVVLMSAFVPAHQAGGDERECQNRMSEETAAYIRKMRIPLRGADSEFYGNGKEQVYVLNSGEVLSLNSRRPVGNTFAVVNHRDARGRSSFYVMEQEVAREQITISIKRDSKLLLSLPVKLVTPRALGRVKDLPSQGECDRINEETNEQVASFLASANQTCKTYQACLPRCNPANQSVAQLIMIFEPTSWRCKLDATQYEAGFAHHFLVEVDEGSLLDQAFEVAIKNVSRRYTYQP